MIAFILAARLGSWPNWTPEDAGSSSGGGGGQLTNWARLAPSVRASAGHTRGRPWPLGFASAAGRAGGRRIIPLAARSKRGRRARRNLLAAARKLAGTAAANKRAVVAAANWVACVCAKSSSGRAPSLLARIDLADRVAPPACPADAWRDMEFGRRAGRLGGRPVGSGRLGLARVEECGRDRRAAGPIESTNIEL